MSDGGASTDRGLREARVISRHLDPAYTASADAVTDASETRNETSSTSNEEVESSLKLQGGDVHRDLYKIDARAGLHQRSATFSHSQRQRPLEDSSRTPGAFRRQFLLQQKRYHSVTTPVTRNFIAFLDLYGSFAGEDLAESDEEGVEDDEEEGNHDTAQAATNARGNGERRPLLGHRKSSRAPKKGDASLTKTFFLLLKSFIGTGVLFLPKAFKNGGLLFSSITLILVSLISCLAFHLLLQCRAKYGGGYGELGEAIGGRRMRSVILTSITVSQIGFVCAGVIFTAENLHSFLNAVIKTNHGAGSPLSINALIALELVLLVPLALVRNISKLGSSALLADVCILLGLGYIYYFEITAIASQGINPTVELFNPRDFTLTVGSAIFTFEGIGLILPIQSAMREPQKFGRLLYLVMLLITIIFTSIGALSYATFGDKTNVEIISNFPQDSNFVNAVQFLYSLAVLVGTPVQLFPAMRIIEGSLFGHLSGKRDAMTKWKKNAFRTGILCLCGIVSALGASDLDKFVALIGSFACVPLVYIYPAFLHWKGVAQQRYVKWGDILFMVLGVVAMIYTTAVTLYRWSES